MAPELTGSVDFVFNFALTASPEDFTKLAKEIALVNSVGAIHMLRFATDHKAHYLEASASEAYGELKEHLLSILFG